MTSSLIQVGEGSRRGKRMAYEEGAQINLSEIRVLPSLDPAADGSWLHDLRKVWSIPPLHKADPEISGLSQQTYFFLCKNSCTQVFSRQITSSKWFEPSILPTKAIFNWLIKVNYDQDAY